MFTILVFLGGVAAGAAFTPFWLKVWAWFKGEATTVEARLAALEAKVKAATAPKASVTPAPTATVAATAVPVAPEAAK